MRLHRGAPHLAPACLIGFCCFFASYLRMPVVPLLAVSLGASTVQVGVINGVFMATACLLSIPSGMISDRLGRRITLLGGLLILAASSFLLFRSTSLLQMATCYLCFGIGMSTFSPALMAYVGDITPPQGRGRAMGWYTMAMYAGMTLGPAAGGFLAKPLGLRPVLLIAGGVVTAMLLVALRFLPTPSTGTGRGAAPPPLPRDSAPLLHNRPLMACLLAVLGSCIGYGTFVTFMPLYLHTVGMDTAQVGIVFAAGALTNTLARQPSGRLCDRLQERGVLVCAGLALFALAVGGFGACSELWHFLLCAALMGAGMGTAYTAICAIIADAMPRELRGLAVGCYNTCIYAGMLLSALGMGPVVEAGGFRVAFLLNGGIGIAVLMAFRCLYRGRGEAGALFPAGECASPLRCGAAPPVGEKEEEA